MNNSINNRRNVAKTERLQRRLDAGFLSTHFPEVARIVITMIYSQRGIGKSLPRTVYFFPDSPALFKIDCLSKDCLDGGFDLTHVITGMIRTRREAAKGELGCEGNDLSAGHSDIVYEVAIQYA